MIIIRAFGKRGGGMGLRLGRRSPNKTRRNAHPFGIGKGRRPRKNCRFK